VVASSPIARTLVKLNMLYKHVKSKFTFGYMAIVLVHHFFCTVLNDGRDSGKFLCRKFLMIKSCLLPCGDFSEFLKAFEINLFSMTLKFFILD